MTVSRITQVWRRNADYNEVRFLYWVPNMLNFCTWKDEDGRHYGVTNKHPKAYFNWPGCHLCDPKYVRINAEQARQLFEQPNMTVTDALDRSFVEVEIADWEMFLNIRPKMTYLY